MSGDTGTIGSSDAPEPIFIGGTGRSGTHALARLLGRHSQLADVPIEARFHCNKRGLPDLIEGRVTLAGFMAKLRGFWWHRVRVDGRPRGLYNLHRRADFDAACERFEAAYPDDPIGASRRLVLDLLGPVAERAGKPGLVEMSSHNVKEAQTLLRLFPRARVIHALARRPRLRDLGHRQDLGPRQRRPRHRLVGGAPARHRARRPLGGGRRALPDPAGELPRRPARRPRRPRSRPRLRRAARLPRSLRRGRDPLVLRELGHRRGRPRGSLARRDRPRRPRPRRPPLPPRRRRARAAGQPRGAGAAGGPRPRGGAGVSRRKAGRKVLFATSNGTGLGHLNRAMSIARRLPDGIEPVLFTLSQAVPAVVEAGFRVEYFPSYRRPASGSDWQWNLRLRRRLERLLADERPDLVVFDGVHPYRALTHVLSASGAPRSVWCRRPMWNPRDARRAPDAHRRLRRRPRARRARGRGRRGPDRRAARRGRARRSDRLPRPRRAAQPAAGGARARPRPGPDDRARQPRPGRRDRPRRRPGARAPRARSPTCRSRRCSRASAAGSRSPTGVVRLDATFPMSRYFHAFDLAVAASGYNAFHELIAFGVPTLFVPMPRNTDDQAARARWAAAAGHRPRRRRPRGRALSDELEPLLDEDARDEDARGVRARLGRERRLRRRRARRRAGRAASASRAERAQCAAAAASTAGGATRATRVGPSLPLALGAHRPRPRRPPRAPAAEGRSSTPSGSRRRTSRPS